jgi:hypothetical protein
MDYGFEDDYGTDAISYQPTVGRTVTQMSKTSDKSGFSTSDQSMLSKASSIKKDFEPPQDRSKKEYRKGR